MSDGGGRQHFGEDGQEPASPCLKFAVSIREKYVIILRLNPKEKRNKYADY